MYHVDLDSDLNESFGVYTIDLDKEVTAQVPSMDVTCGYHAGDSLVMTEVARLRQEAGVAIGAHPGFPDLMGPGRHSVACSSKKVRAYMSYQPDALYAFTKAAGLKLQHVKPHGVLYNMAIKDAAPACAITEAVAELDDELILPSLADSFLLTEAKVAGLRTVSEAFADRAYQVDGSLASRSKEGVVIRNKQLAIARTVHMVKEGKVTAITGEGIPLHTDSICVHGDDPSAVEFVCEIRKISTEEDVQAEAPDDSIQ